MKPVVIWIAIVFALYGCKEKYTISLNESKEDRLAVYKLMDHYSYAYEKGDWDKLADLIHPGAFDFITRAEFKRQLDSSLSRKNYTMSIKSLDIDTLYPFIRYRSNKYSLLITKMNADMKFNMEIDSSVCDKLNADTTVEIVECHTQGEHLFFTSKEKGYAIYLAEHGKWYFLTHARESQKMVNKLIPEKVREKLGH